MGIFKRSSTKNHTPYTSTSKTNRATGRRRSPRMAPALVCPSCHSLDLALGYIDRVKSTVLHRCQACGHRWTDDLIDLADAEIAARGRH